LFKKTIYAKFLGVNETPCSKINRIGTILKNFNFKNARIYKGD